MKNERIIKNYYRKAFFKGKNIFARITDFIAFRIIAYIILYIWFLPMLKNPVLKLVLPMIALIALSIALQLFKSIRLERFCVKHKEALKNKLLCESFTVLKECELLDLVSEYIKSKPEKFNPDCEIYIFQQTAPLTTDDILKLYQNALNRNLKHAVLFCTCDIAKEAELFMEKYRDSVDICPISSNELAKHMQYIISDDAVNEYIITQEHEHKASIKKAFTEPFYENSAKKYFTVAVLLCITSFFVKYPLYYRTVATIASSFGFVSLYFSKNRQKEGG